MGNVPPNAQGSAGGGTGGGGPGSAYGGYQHQPAHVIGSAGGTSTPSSSSPSRGGGGAVSYPAPMVQGSTYTNNNYHNQHHHHHPSSSSGPPSVATTTASSSASSAVANQYQPYASQNQSPSSVGVGPASAKQRTGSHGDITMAEASGGGGGAIGGMGSSAAANAHHAALLAAAEEDTVPTVFRWEHGGRQVYITGTFNDWSRQIPMHRSGNDFTYIHNLRRGKHAFKFIVDDEWRFAPDQPTVADIEGRINNFIDVSDFVPYTGDRFFEERVDGGGVTAAILAAGPPANLDGMTGADGGAGEERKEADMVNGDHHHQQGGGPHGHHHDHHHHSSIHGGEDSTAATQQSIMAKHYYAEEAKEADQFGQTMPDLDEYTKEPPPLPPHLRHIILNKAPQLADTSALPVPQHVALNHLYCTAIKDNMMVLGITQRHKTKFATTVYYSPCS